MMMANKTFAAFDDKGEIVFSAYCAEEVAALNMQINGFSQYVEVSYAVRGDTDYILDGEAVPRPSMGSTANGNTLSGVLEGSTLLIEGQSYTADGTDVELEFTLPGAHTVKVSLWPYLDQEFVIENSAQQ
ncbi:hypothetical protein [Pseudomonas sp. CFBP 8772]|uniref:hypothetical protein n=1 Tax=Pseudomonas sp. CFBP 8772 TaxID=2775284 RepID=UPI00177CC13B|nr:hypothetical protein [Pseudomonas sp. CFBP 8772]MBD8597388.1 hypothetical protein [Pseudomonas sp. CFBP 8772]